MRFGADKVAKSAKLAYGSRFKVGDVVTIQDQVTTIMNIDPFTSYPYQVKEPLNTLTKGVEGRGGLVADCAYDCEYCNDEGCEDCDAY